MTGETRGRPRAGARDHNLVTCRLAVPRLELGNATACIKYLLLPSIERVTLRADIGMDRAAFGRATRGECATARAGDDCFNVHGVNISLHCLLLLSAPGRSPAPAE